MSVNGWDAFSSDAPFCHRTGTAAASILSDYMPRSSRVLLKPGGIASTAIEAFDKVRAGECSAAVYPNWIAEDALLYEANAACDMRVSPSDAELTQTID
jgi:hypothetical protein